MVKQGRDVGPARLFTENSRRLPILVRPNVRRYWLTFESPERPPSRGISLICWPPPHMGLSAFDRDDALRLFTAYFMFVGMPEPVLEELEEDVDLSEERFDHYRRHGLLGCPIWRGVWYPGPSCGYIWSPVSPL